MKQVKRIRETLTAEERKTVAEHLEKNHPEFWRFVNVFFHSGARESELMRLKGKDVNLQDQTFKVTVLKGSSPEEVRKVIKTIALPFWIVALNECKPDEYVFSKGLKPGNTAISSNQITRRWLRHVKKALGIKADFYSLKHANTSEVVDLLSDEDAAKLNSHKGTGMVVKIYDTKRKDRQTERLKKINNKFA
jgi:integrase